MVIPLPYQYVRIQNPFSQECCGRRLDYIQDLTYKEICNVSFDELSQRDTPLDIASTATPERYRLVDCAAVVSNRVLRIEEFTEFPRVIYAALSYVWRGNSLANNPNNPSQEFSVQDTKDADPIGLDVLHDACAASLASGASHLWLDRLCIMQTNKQDKWWQIREMYRLYCFATVCVVVPGGLRFLVSFSEETEWIHRGWTLQEVVAPPSVAVLFSWSHGPGELRAEGADGTSYGTLEVVTPQRLAMTSLQFALDACTIGHFQWIASDNATVKTASCLVIEAALFGKQPSDSGVSYHGNTAHILLPHVSALSFAIAKNLDTDEMRDFSIWQCALLRTSSHPLDMVLSIMGILGVSLDLRDFPEDDRIGATIALAWEILRQGRSASWLGISVYLPPCPFLSTCPVFPKTSVAGKALFNFPGGEQEAARYIEAVYPNQVGLCPHPKGSMDEHGYHAFVALAIRVLPAHTETTLSADSLYDHPARPAQLRAVDGSTWTISADLATLHNSGVASAKTQRPRSFAVLLGFYNGFPAATTGNNIRAMPVTEHAEDMYHVRSYFLLSCEVLHWASTWKEHYFCVGGPEPYMPPQSV
ncbi:hypothetical protein IW261DRAFT_1350595 [Armillaria novae-zelandiae]|uniref:Heterokaryon incompatibility domain-containing protein n=1 Tax=Armillaria novae-zelandiae TaxID=153914 RepID=A0AA39KIM5_9AGAR|nr:hypothetical protein IW261DRAFT_1350595 [Armillaria novae-zelandiae]